MKKILFIINKTSDSKYQTCVNAINDLKNTCVFVVGFASYADGEPLWASDVYLAMQEQHNPDISIIMDDTVLLVNENLLRDIVKIFKSDSLIGVIGIKGAEHLPDSGIMDEASNIYGGLYEMNHQGEVFEKKWQNSLKGYAEVEAVSSTMVAVRGYIPVWRDISSKCIGEVLSVAAAIQGYKVVVPKDSPYWCFSTLPEQVPAGKELEIIKAKHRFRNILLRKDHPILTIGIPTFNCSRYFRKCISNLYKHIGDMPWIEIFVSNNDSTDDTEEIASQYLHHKNFRYYKQPVNIVDRNFSYLYENARGDFVVACGDDDYYSPEAILNLLETICMYPQAAVIELTWPPDHIPASMKLGEGIDVFLEHCGLLFTCISCVVLNQKKYMKIEVKDRFSHTSLNQCYVQLQMVKQEHIFVKLFGDNFLPESAEAAWGRKFKKNERRPFCDIFVKEYQQILDYFLDKGLSREAYEKMKKTNLQYVLHWLEKITLADGTVYYSIDDDVAAIMETFYGNEPYYDELKRKLKDIILHG